MTSGKKTGLLAIIGPGILVAATGVGAGDLATGALTGSKLGVAVLWAVVIGAGLKYVLNEGLARWQLATGDTLLEGCVKHFGRPVRYVFLLYLLFWSFFVGSALMSACGITAHAIVPLVGPETDKVIYGMMHSAAAVFLVRLGGYKLFEKVMSACIALMFLTVVITAVAVQPDLGDVIRGLLLPWRTPFSGDGLQWTVALMGGVGGTLTILCYGYWIREERREGLEELQTCRIDLATGYAMTAIFGLGMVVLGSRITPQGSGVRLIVLLADQLQSELGAVGPAARWAFLIGAWGAVASSLLGVWQSVPYLFADFWNLTHAPESTDGGEAELPRQAVDTNSRPYQFYLYGIAVVPAFGLFVNFQDVQKVYAIFGAAFIPLLAAALLILNGNRTLVGVEGRNSAWTQIVLIAALAFFSWAGWYEIQQTVAD